MGNFLALHSTKSREKIMDRVIIEYSEDGNEVCLIPDPVVPLDIMRDLIDLHGSKGFRWWVPSDNRRGYRFVRELNSKLEEECKAALHGEK